MDLIALSPAWAVRISSRVNSGFFVPSLSVSELLPSDVELLTESEVKAGVADAVTCRSCCPVGEVWD